MTTCFHGSNVKVLLAFQVIVSIVLVSASVTCTFWVSEGQIFQSPFASCTSSFKVTFSFPRMVGSFLIVSRYCSPILLTSPSPTTYSFPISNVFSVPFTKVTLEPSLSIVPVDDSPFAGKICG